MPFQKNSQKICKEKNEHCDRQTPTKEYSRNTEWLLFFFESKTYYVNHALFFIHSSFFKRLYQQLLTLKTSHLVSCVNWLMPGGNNRP